MEPFSQSSTPNGRSPRSKYASARYSTAPAGPDSDLAQAYDLADLNSASVELWFDLRRRRRRLRLRFQPASERLARSSDPIQMKIYVRRFFMHKTRKRRGARCKLEASRGLGESPVLFSSARPAFSSRAFRGAGGAGLEPELKMCFIRKNAETS